ITNADGRTWEIPYSYRAHAFAVTPDPIELLDVTAGAERTLRLALTNQRPFNGSVLAIRLANGATGFSLRDLGDLGKSIRPGDSISVTLAFTGNEKNTSYYDILIVVTSCGTYFVPVHAHTGPSPVPQIT